MYCIPETLLRIMSITCQPVFRDNKIASQIVVLTSSVYYIFWYFPDISKPKFDVVRNPFLVNMNMSMPILDEMNEAREQLINMMHDSNVRDIFNSSSLSKFWCRMMAQYPAIAHFALKLIVPFPSTYLCEIAFSSLLIIKSKYRNRLNTESDLRCCLSTREPRINILMDRKQAQSSH